MILCNIKTFLARAGFSQTSHIFVYLNNTKMTTRRTRLMTIEIDKAAIYASVGRYSALLTTAASERNPRNIKFLL
jgi:hypothetical protein